jgi:two-component system, OmpR family, sensor kinase
VPRPLSGLRVLGYQPQMTVRWRIILLAGVALAFIASMIGIMAFGLHTASALVQRIDGVHHRFEALANLDSRSNDYADEAVKALRLEPEQMNAFLATRTAMESALDRLTTATRAKVLTLRGLHEVQQELADVESTSRMTELFRSIDQAADRVLELQRGGNERQALEVFRREVEHRLSYDFERLVANSLQDERDDVAAELHAVRQRFDTLLLAAIALSIVALACAAALGLVLNRAIVRPVRVLSTGAREIAEGRLDHRIVVRGNDEFASLSRTFNDMAAAIEEQRMRLVRAQQRLGSEVEARTRELREANERLRDLDDRRAQFLADVSHELRTPLTVLRGEADVALRAGSASEQLEALRRIQGQAAELGRLLEDLLAFARSEADDQAFESVRARACDIVTAAVREGEVLAAAHDVSILADYRDGGVRIEADLRRLKQALVIGLDNAVKHSPAGGQIRVATAALDRCVTISIADEGDGVPETDRPHVFQRFFRGRAETARPGGGIGIGLSIAKEIVERHEGTIALDNRPGGGAVLSISIPLAASEAEVTAS